MIEGQPWNLRAIQNYFPCSQPWHHDKAVSTVSFGGLVAHWTECANGALRYLSRICKHLGVH